MRLFGIIGVLCAMLAAGNAGAQTISDLSRGCMTDLLGYCWRTDFGAPVAVEGAEHLLVAEPAPTLAAAAQTTTPVTTVGSSAEVPLCLHVVGQSYEQCTMPNGFQFVRYPGSLAPSTTWQGLSGGAEMECGRQADGTTIPCTSGTSVPTLDEARRICERLKVTVTVGSSGEDDKFVKDHCLPMWTEQTSADIAALKAFVEHQK